MIKNKLIIAISILAICCNSKDKNDLPLDPNPKLIINPKIQEIVNKLLEIDGKPFEELLDEYIEKHPEDKGYCEENKESIEFMFNLQNPHSPSPQTPPPPPQPVPQKNEKKNKEIVDELKDKELEDKMEKYKEPQPTEQKNFVDDNKEEIRKEYKKQQEKKKNLCPNCKKDPCECENIDVDKLFDESEWFDKIKDKKEEIEKLKKGAKDIFQFLKNTPDDEFGLKKKIKQTANEIKNKLSKTDPNDPDPIAILEDKCNKCNKSINSYPLRKRICQFSKSQNISYGYTQHTMNIENEFNRIAEEVANENPSQWTKEKALRWLKCAYYISHFIPGTNIDDDNKAYNIEYDDKKSYNKKQYQSYEEQYNDYMNGFVKNLDFRIGNWDFDRKGNIITINPKLFDGFDKSKVAKKIIENANKHKAIKLPEAENGIIRCYFGLDGTVWYQMLAANPDLSLKGRQFDILGNSTSLVIYDRISSKYHCLGNIEDTRRFWNSLKWNDKDGCFEVK